MAHRLTRASTASGERVEKCSGRDALASSAAPPWRAFRSARKAHAPPITRIALPMEPANLTFVGIVRAEPRERRF